MFVPVARRDVVRREMGRGTWRQEMTGNGRWTGVRRAYAYQGLLPLMLYEVASRLARTGNTCFPLNRVFELHNKDRSCQTPPRPDRRQHGQHPFMRYLRKDISTFLVSISDKHVTILLLSSAKPISSSVWAGTNVSMVVSQVILCSPDFS